MKIGETLRYLRKGANLTLREMSELTGYSLTYLSDLECRKKDNPTVATLQRVCNAMNVSLEEFFWCAEGIS